MTVTEGDKVKELAKGSESVGVAMAEFGLDWRSKANNTSTAYIGLKASKTKDPFIVGF